MYPKQMRLMWGITVEGYYHLVLLLTSLVHYHVEVLRREMLYHLSLLEHLLLTVSQLLARKTLTGKYPTMSSLMGQLCLT